MATKNEIKFLHSLQQKKFRQLHRRFTVEGTKSVAEVLHSGFEVENVYATEAWQAAHPDMEIPGLQTISEKECALASGLQTPPGILACVRFREEDENQALELPERILVLDGIQDSGNFGTILRTADWFGFPLVVCSHGTVELYNPKTVQASMGSFTRVRVSYRDLPAWLSELPEDYRIYGTFLNGNDLRKKNFAPRAAVVIGSEAHGISPEVEVLVHEKLSIPRIAEHPVDSLNAAVATALLCYEMTR
ncbi:MAG: RNA methyltransferase [Bacteroidales bacterium]|nr:RNA methyltransferase [Bacteroidales bacterium]